MLVVHPVVHPILLVVHPKHIVMSEDSMVLGYETQIAINAHKGIWALENDLRSILSFQAVSWLI